MLKLKKHALRFLEGSLAIVMLAGIAAPAKAQIPANHIRIHYNRPDGNYSGWTVYAYDDTTENTGGYQSGPVPVSGTDAYGAYFDVGVTASPQVVGLIIHNPTAAGGDNKDPGPNTFVNPSTEGNEYWAISGIAKLYTSLPDLVHPTALLPGYARIHYFRPDENYTGWSVYAYADTQEPTSNFSDGPTPQTGSDSYGAYYDIKLIPNPAFVGIIVHNGNTKDPGPDMQLRTFKSGQSEAWVVSGSTTLYTSLPTPAQIAAAGLAHRQAFWIDRSTIAIPGSAPKASGSYSLVYSVSAGIAISNTGAVTGGTAIPLTPAAGGLTSAQAAQFPQLAGYTVLQVPSAVSIDTLKQALTGQVVISASDPSGNLQYVTGVQNAGVLDDLFYYPGALGAVFAKGQLSISVWAPTAQSVKLLLYNQQGDTTPAQTIPMTAANGVWTVEGQNSWKGKYYLFDEVVYVPSQQQVVENVVTDPYSVDLALNGVKTRVTDLNDDSTKPPGWDASQSPYLGSKNEFSVYELHVREFSVGDTSVPEEHRGTYLAFTDYAANGMTHLQRLAKAGLKAVHLMPTFHIGSVNEDKSKWQNPVGLTPNPPDGTGQQAAVTTVQGSDGYNFGYDPVHYMAPNGGYAFNPDNRVQEYRRMVASLHKAGLRVVQDVVFNHTYANGEDPFSVLDQVVPGYYQRLDADGNVQTASCCSDTASEHRMMEKLMIDATVLAAREYKIDGFRFDYMSLHFVSNMQHIQQALRQLTVENDGVDGSKIYIYGEGFLSPGTAALGVNATQVNLYGSGIGTFNDRIRDGIRGGSIFSASSERDQGFATGLYTDPSLYTTATLGQSLADQETNLNLQADWIRIGLTGSLRDFTFVDSTGATVKGSEVMYSGQPTGYAASPLEAVNYCSVHDNQPLFDAIQLKSALPGTSVSGGDSIATRTRRQVLAMSLIALGQGVPFFFGGDDLLRSKDMDNGSYNSGDWFNKVNWAYQGDRPGSSNLFAEESNNWGIGLPLGNVNLAQWSFMQPLLADPSLAPTPTEISSSAAAFQMFLGIRTSSDLFHMATLIEVQNNLHFLNTGTSQVPGLIVMKLDANGGTYGKYNHIVVVFNGTLTSVKFQDNQLMGLGLQLHPLQVGSPDAQTAASVLDDTTGTATVAGLTTAVFVAR